MAAMSVSLPAAPAAAPPLPISRGRYTLILAALTLGGFAIGTSEFAGMGRGPRYRELTRP